jgi:hypothetical protein
VTAPAGAFSVGDTLQLAATAKNAADETVLVPAANITWGTSAAGAATIDTASGLATGVAAGEVTFTATEAESHQQATITRTVRRLPRLYVLDGGNRRIVSFLGMHGADWTTIPTTGMAHPQSLCVAATGEIYVVGWNTCSFSGGVFFYGSPIGHVTSIAAADWTLHGSAGAGDGQLKDPQSIFVTDAGTIYVTDYWNSRVVAMSNLAGAGWTVFGTGSIASNYGIWVTPAGTVYLTVYMASDIARFSNMTGADLTLFGTPGGGGNQFAYPQSLCVPGDGYIYVADTENNRIVRLLEADFSDWTTYGTSGDAAAGPGHFRFPYGVFVYDGQIYVSDSGNNRIVRIDDMQGTGWTVFGGAGSGVNQFTVPRALWVQ